MNNAYSNRLAGVMGWPVRQSLSPRLHGFWLREHDVDGAYISLPVRTTDFSAALRGARATGFAGVNVTIPHKQAAFAIADHVDPEARAAGAANLLLFRDERIEARNTDIAGLQANLVAEIGPDGIRAKSVIVLGAGGAARAAVLACDALKAAEIHILNRTDRRAAALLHNLSAFTSARLGAGGLEAWADVAPAATLLVHATSAGMDGMSSLDLDLGLLPLDAVVCDLVYRPLETPILARARALNLRGIDGLGMLMHQAVPAFEAFYGVRPRVTPVLRADLESALRG
jgi:shikimate dehydrogenase